VLNKSLKKIGGVSTLRMRKGEKKSKNPGKKKIFKRDITRTEGNKSKNVLGGS